MKRHRGPPLTVWMLAVAILALLIAASVIGFHLSERPFIHYNRARIAAVAEQAARDPNATIVVALGASRLRHATLDEADMAALGAERGIPNLRLLRIVHNSGQFGDFAPFLDDLLALRPRLVLLEIDLLFKERRTLPFYHYYLRDTLDVVARGRPYHRDEGEHQFGKPCVRRDEPAWDQDRARLDRFAANVTREMRFAADSPAYDRARRFIERAKAQGTQVAVIQLRSRSNWETRQHGPGRDYRPDALARVEQDPAMALWRFPASLQSDARYCDYVHLTEEGRDAYSAWLIDRIADALHPTRSVDARPEPPEG